MADNPVLGVYMESGELQFDWEQTSQNVALLSFGSNGEESLSLLRRLVEDASDSYPQLSQLRFVHIPIPVSKLENWSHLLAAQVVDYWRDLPVEERSVATITDELGLSSAESRNPLLDALDKTATGTSLTLQLAMLIELLSERQRQQKLTPSLWQQWLEQEAAGLAEWFSQPPPISSGSSQSLIKAGGCLAQLHFTLLARRSTTLHQLQGCFIQLRQAGPRSLLAYLGSLDEVLDRIRADCEEQRQECLRRESSAWRAYYSLKASLEKPNWAWFSQVHLQQEAVLRALTTAYEFKLRAEISTQAAQLVSELVQQTRLYATSIAQLDAMLASLKDWFAERGSVEPLFVPMLRDSLTEQVNIAQLRSELENWVGCALQEWNALDSTRSEALREQILARLRPLCLELYADCCRYILNLEIPSRQDQSMTESSASAKLVTTPPNSEKRVSLHVRDAEIRDVLTVLSQASEGKFIADESIIGTVSLSLHDFSITEAINALIAASNLTYTKSGSVYTFSQQPKIDSSTTVIP